MALTFPGKESVVGGTPRFGGIPPFMLDHARGRALSHVTEVTETGFMSEAPAFMSQSKSIMASEECEGFLRMLDDLDMGCYVPAETTIRRPRVSSLSHGDTYVSCH